MACFIVPASEAVFTTVVSKIIRRNEIRKGTEPEERFSEKLGWLNKMLWGGSALLAFEHVWHGEVIPFPPFLTAASDPSSAAVMLHEMATSGVAMAVLVTCVWAAMVAACSVIRKRKTDNSLHRKGAAES